MEAQTAPGQKVSLMKLFGICFTISAFTFGGGLVIMSMLQKKFVEELHWIEQDEMMDLIAIAQASPGVMAVNSTIIIGYRIAGVPGALVSVLGTILPPMIIFSVISFFYKQFRSNRVIALILKGMQAGVAAVLIHLSFTMSAQALSGRKGLAAALLAGSVTALLIFGADVIYVILVCGIIGGMTVLLEGRKESKA